MAYDLSAIVEQRTEALGGETVEFTFNGETFTMPHPLLADDEWKEEVAEVGNNDVDQARAYLGDEQYERYRAAGGRAGYVAFLIEKIVGDTQEAMSDGRPTQSSTSSGNTRKRRKRT